MVDGADCLRRRGRSESLRGDARRPPITVLSSPYRAVGQIQIERDGVLGAESGLLLLQAQQALHHQRRRRRRGRRRARLRRRRASGSLRGRRRSRRRGPPRRAARRSGRSGCRAALVRRRTAARSARRPPTVNTRTLPSISSDAARGNVAGASDLKRRSSQPASTSPVPAPAIASRMLSVSSCRTMRHRAAPSAVRIASSRRRATLRASSRLATFAHAMSRTNATAPCRTSNVRRLLSTMISWSGQTRMPRFNPRSSLNARGDGLQIRSRLID